MHTKSSPSNSATLHGVLQEAARPLLGAGSDYDDLLKMIGEARYVLLGEATHGTHEFYDARARFTRRLIEEMKFSAVVVEADWPDAYRVNRYVTGMGPADAARDALSDFQRFPRWMWRNNDVLQFAYWLRQHNDTRAAFQRVGFYGMDLYSLYRSIEAVIDYLKNVDPDAATTARRRYACFEQFGEDPQAYGYAARAGMSASCEKEVIAQLMELRVRSAEFLSRDGWVAEDEHFQAEQNARLAINAEAYYRAMFGGRTQSWNLRDTHMADTLEALVRHLSRGGRPAKLVVWAHNSHMGDVRATECAAGGELNVGQLIRQRNSFGDVVLVGFTTYSGTVAAASDWGEPVEIKRVNTALPGSIESDLHEVAAEDGGTPNFWLNIRDDRDLANALRPARLERAIGVVYRPDTERLSHYFHTRVSEQFDALIHFDQTSAVEPFERE
ncbi:MAG TPA: erythromycin esterase family protein [Phycisphaerae bacterium]|nr:erythromycin esterase family protein [Phycisphaerae bacterium]